MAERRPLVIRDDLSVGGLPDGDTMPLDSITGLTAALSAKLEGSDISGLQDTSEKGAANGYASLDGGGKVPSSQLPDVGGGADWGDIGGTLSDQTDLQAALNGKVNVPPSPNQSSVYRYLWGSANVDRDMPGADSRAYFTGEGGPLRCTTGFEATGGEASCERTSGGAFSRAALTSLDEGGGVQRPLLELERKAELGTQRAVKIEARKVQDLSYTGSPLISGNRADHLSLILGGSDLADWGISVAAHRDGNTSIPTSTHLGPAGNFPLRIETNNGPISTRGGNINSGGGNITGTSGCQIGWSASATSPTGSGTNCHINTSGKLVRQTSQGKLKEDQAPLETTIDEIMAWQPKSFRWVEEMGGHEDIGLIAEEVSALDPRAAWHDHDQVLQCHEEPSDPEDPNSETVEVQRYACCPEQPVVPLGVHYERAWVHLLAATQDFYRRYQEERSELLARIEALEGGA